MINLKRILVCILLTTCFNLVAQEIIITGIIRDKSGYLAGANVKIKGSKISTVSDFDGSYSIKAKIGDLLVFDFFRCESVEKKIISLEKLNIFLKEVDRSICMLGTSRYSNESDFTKKQEKTYPIAIDKTINFDLENNFKNDIANKSLKIYVFENKTNTISQNEFNFQNKYKTTFTTFYKISNDYYENYNKKVFDYLEDNFNDKWQNEINSDILGFEQWQNN